jgi:hypothetical protein
MSASVEEPLTTPPHRNLLIEGFRVALRNWPCVVWVYAITLVFALLTAVPFSYGISPYIDHSLEAEKIAGTLDVAALGELGMQLRDAGFFPMVARNARWLQTVEQLLLFVLFAGSVFVFVTAEPPRASVLLRGGVAYFWRFVRAALLAGCVAIVVLGALLALRAVLLSRAENTIVGQPMFWISAATGLVILLVGLLIRLWWDVLEIYVVRNAMDGEVRVRYAAPAALRFLRRHFLSLSGSFLLSGLAGIAAFALCVYFWKLLPAHQIWVAMILAQFGLFFLLAGRFWQRGVETWLVMTKDPPHIIREEMAVEEMAVELEEGNPAPFLPEPVEGAAEPTLQDLVLKLRSEPWAKTEPGPEPVLISAPVPEPEPIQSNPVTEPYTALLERHKAKLPLGEKPQPDEPKEDEPKE